MKLEVGEILKSNEWYYIFEYRDDAEFFHRGKKTKYQLRQLYPNSESEEFTTTWWSDVPYEISKKEVLRSLKARLYKKVEEKELAIVYLLNDYFPQIEYNQHNDERWKNVKDPLRNSMA